MASQTQKMEAARKALADKFDAFMHIMTGPTPLTQDEMKILIQKNPAVYGFLQHWIY